MVPTRPSLIAGYDRVRSFTLALVEPLANEDLVVQTMPEVSPTKWHLGHTTWFFETFVLRAAAPDYRPFDPRYHHLFNSYYQVIGEPPPRERRGQWSRPTVSEVRDYRRHVDAAMRALLSGASDELLAAHAATIEVGIHHEEQHQELILTDVKHVLASNPLGADYRRRPAHPSRAAAPLEWRDQAGGTIALGHPGGEFSYDNEQPRHRVWLEPFQLASRAVTCGEWLAFITDGGYLKPELWLAEGFDACVAGRWRAPLYWEARDGAWTIATLDGRRPLDESEPVCHVSWFEADAFARFSGARLPSEAEWELAASGQPVRGNFVESGALHPRPATNPPGGLAQLFGDVWEWTASPYRPYPGYRPFQGALAEYNGKFMCNQFVLRGGSCASPERHLRATYRNFFPPTARWQFTGLRLARDGR